MVPITRSMAVLVGAAVLAAASFMSRPAAADRYVSIHTPKVSVSVGKFGGHKHKHFEFRHHGRRSGHDRHRVAVYRKVDYRPKHVCRYEKRPVRRSYYDECGRNVYYTDYVAVRVCDARYHR